MATPTHATGPTSPKAAKPFFGNAPQPTPPFFTPAPTSVQKEDAPETPAKDKEPDVPIQFGSFEVFCQLFDDLIIKWPKRWQQSYQSAKKHGGNTLFDPKFGEDLISKEIMSLYNIFWAIQLQSNSPYGSKVDFSKGLEMAEQLTGVSGTWLNLASIALHMDMEKYLGEKIPLYAKQNLGIFLISGALLQSGLVGLNALTKSELDFTSILGPATKKWTEPPGGFSRPFVLDNIPDDRWRPPFYQPPKAFELKYSGTDEKAEEKKLSLGLGFNLASALGKYPDDEKEKAKYKGLELFPYFQYFNSEAIPGKPDPKEQHKFMLGLYGGDKGVYGLGEGGGRFNGDQLLEGYGRGGVSFRNFGRLSLLDLTGEVDYRPDAEAKWRGRLNAAAQFNILDSKRFEFNFGAGAGALLPSGGQPGAMDYRTQLSFMHKYNDKRFSQPLKSGVEFTYNYGLEDPFSADSSRISGFGARAVFMSMLKGGFERFEHYGKSDTLPEQDLHFFLAFDFAPVFARKREEKKDK
ncbi:hypothetical protein [Chitinophaga caseinilytica]|uniref:hypothetical protein n=1 Tax=Chitinophaga caseinilytica TaxID=2267521 RepID=UPI003C2E8520